MTALSKLPGYAASGSLSFTPPSSGGASTVRMRAEFVAVDLNDDGDSTDVDEGFLSRVPGEPRPGGLASR